MLILGYGNPLLGDDAVGPAAADQLAQLYAGDPRVDVQIVHQLTIDLAEVICGYKAIILIDAGTTGTPGTLFHETVTATPNAGDPFSHYLAPGELLAVTQALHASAPPTVLCGIVGSQFEPGAGLSRQVAEAFPALLAAVAALVSDTTG